MKYCWEYTDDYLEYRSSCGLDTKNPRWYMKDFSRYLKDNYPNLVDLYNEIHANDQLVILFDKAKKLEPQDLAQILKIIDTFNKETK